MAQGRFPMRDAESRGGSGFPDVVGFLDVVGVLARCRETGGETGETHGGSPSGVIPFGAHAPMLALGFFAMSVHILRLMTFRHKKNRWKRPR